MSLQCSVAKVHFHLLIRSADSRNAAMMCFMEGLAAGVGMDTETFGNVVSVQPTKLRQSCPTNCRLIMGRLSWMRSFGSLQMWMHTCVARKRWQPVVDGHLIRLVGHFEQSKFNRSEILPHVRLLFQGFLCAVEETTKFLTLKTKKK